MKFKLDLRSIKLKTWMYFVLFTMFLVTVLWGLQVLLINNFYENMKVKQTNTAIESLMTSYDEHYRQRFLSNLEDISRSNDLYIYLVSANGTTMAFHPYDEVSGAGQYYSQIPRINRYLDQSNTGSVLLKIKGIDNTREVLAYAAHLQNPRRATYTVYLFSPLWPVNSTVKILTWQLIYVTIIALIIAALLSVYLSNRITRPIREISNSAERLAAGEYGIVFKGGHYTEINNLADTLTRTSIALEKSEAIQRDLVANVSHDLRTPLTMIKSYAEMIRDLSGDNPEKREKHLQVIIDETDRLNNLVNDLLTVSKMQSDKLTLDIEEFNLTEAVRSIVSTYEIRNEEGFSIKFNCPTDYYVCGDADKLKQVVSNLVTNAIKFCGDDRVVNVSLTKRGRNRVHFSVEDHGVGIAKEELARVWDRYYKASSNMVRATEGSGLGLSICKEILVLHKAEYGVESTLGKGATFWFDLGLTRIDNVPVEPEFRLVSDLKADEKASQNNAENTTEIEAENTTETEANDNEQMSD